MNLNVYTDFILARVQPLFPNPFRHELLAVAGLTFDLSLSLAPKLLTVKVYHPIQRILFAYCCGRGNLICPISGLQILATHQLVAVFGRSVLHVRVTPSALHIVCPLSNLILTHPKP